MKKRILALLLVLSILFSLTANAYELSDLQAPVSGEKIVYGFSGEGRELAAYRFGTGENVLVVGFAIHGYEDNFDKDGICMVYTADRLMQELDKSPVEGDWSVYILPCMNPDGLISGTTCNGPGRCTTTYLDPYGILQSDGGIDLNRCFPHKWEPYTDKRNFNGTEPLQAMEAQAMAAFIEKVKGSSVNLLLDVHGWCTQIIPSTEQESPLFRIFAREFPKNTYANCKNGKGYFTGYATDLGYTACLFEFPEDVWSMEEFQKSGYCEKFITCIYDICREFAPEPQEGTFRDVKKTAWYYDAVEYAVANGIFQGVSEDTFAPNRAMTRAMLVTTLWRMVGSPEQETAAVFTDTEPESWYDKAVAWASANEIVTGYPDGSFAPNRDITREQMATVLYRFAAWQEKDTSFDANLDGFTDKDSVSDYAVDALCWATENGLVQGMADGELMKLCPRNTATRAQTAAILQRYQTAEQTPAVE